MLNKHWLKNVLAITKKTGNVRGNDTGGQCAKINEPMWVSIWQFER